MSKALVIKGASFETNKLDTVTLSETISCTGITLSQNSISASALGSAATLTATLTPENTTETLAWTSSDTDVATVAGGVVTIVGVGTATITATCGSQSATCSVTAEVVMDGSALSAYNGYQFTSTDLTLDPPKDYGGLYPLDYGRVYATTTATESGYKAFSGSSSYTGIIDSYPIILPKNTAVIEVSVPSGFSGNGKIMLFDSTSTQTYITGVDTALVVQYTTGVAPSNNVYSFEITAAQADSFTVQIRSQSANASEVTGDVTFTFKASA